MEVCKKPVRIRVDGGCSLVFLSSISERACHNVMNRLTLHIPRAGKYKLHQQRSGSGL